jgi:putative endonuclease
MSGYSYILFSKRNGTLYVGVTNDLIRRIYEHKSKAVDGFTKKYGVDKLGYFEAYDDISEAIKREKRIKHLGRKAKLHLIESVNPNWEDLHYSLF